MIVSTNRNPKNTNVITEHIDGLMFENLQMLDEAFIKKFSGQYVLPSGAKVPISFNENDEAALVLNNPESWKLFGGSDSDQAQDMEQFNQKSTKLIQATKEKNVEAVTTLSGWTKEDVESFLQQFNKRAETELRTWKDTQILGTVGRRKSTYHLTGVRLIGETKEEFRMVIWQGDRVMEIRPLPDGNTKSFEHVKENEFNSESNNRTIRFETDDKGTKLVLVTAGGDVTARKSN